MATWQWVDKRKRQLESDMQEIWDMWLHDVVGVVCAAWIILFMLFMFIKILLMERQEAKEKREAERVVYGDAALHDEGGLQVVELRWAVDTIVVERKRVKELEKKLEDCGRIQVSCLRRLSLRDAWARAWKAKAKLDRRGWTEENKAPWYHRRNWLGAKSWPVICEDDLICHCGKCGALLQIVRPGKW